MIYLYNYIDIIFKALSGAPPWVFNSIQLVLSDSTRMAGATFLSKYRKFGTGRRVSLS